jgi:antitoxin YefM
MSSSSREGAMDVLTYSDARSNLKEVMDRVVRDRTPVVVTRQKAEAVVMISLSDWNAMEETLHLLSTTANAERLRASVRQLEAGRDVERRLSEE